jgi:hypothetical protein
VEVDREKLYSIETIIEYFKRNRGDAFRRGEDGTERSPEKLKKYFGLNQNKETGEFTWSGKAVKYVSERPNKT